MSMEPYAIFISIHTNLTDVIVDTLYDAMVAKTDLMKTREFTHGF